MHGNITKTGWLYACSFSALAGRAIWGCVIINH
jgi:hypothetical protein